MTRWLSSTLLVGIARSYELIPADLEKPVPPFVSDIESHKLELPLATSASESRRCVHAFTARGRRHKGGRIDPGAYDGIAGNHRTGMNTRLERRRMFEKLRCTGEGEIGLGDDKTRCWTICYIFCPQNYGSRSSVGKH